jgi:hypothetical protein
MLLVDRPVCPDNRGLDIPQCGVDPFEAGGASRGSARAGFDDLMGAPGLGHSPETGQAVADDLAGRIEAALGKYRNRMIAEAGVVQKVPFPGNTGNR